MIVILNAFLSSSEGRRAITYGTFFDPSHRTKRPGSQMGLRPLNQSSTGFAAAVFLRSVSERSSCGGLSLLKKLRRVDR
jgi:hypothetical protein